MSAVRPRVRRFHLLLLSSLLMMLLMPWLRRRLCWLLGPRATHRWLQRFELELSHLLLLLLLFLIKLRQRQRAPLWPVQAQSVERTVRNHHYDHRGVENREEGAGPSAHAPKPPHALAQMLELARALVLVPRALVSAAFLF